MANSERIARAYVELESGARRRDRKRRGLAFAQGVRIAEVKRVLRDYYGVLDHDKDGRALFAILLHSIASIGNPANKLDRCQEVRPEFAPWLSDDEFERMASEAIRSPRRWRADKLAQRLGVTNADRIRLKLCTIGATDRNKEERAYDRQERRPDHRRQRQRERRRAAGMKPRSQSLSQTKPWQALGICRRTWERRQARAVANVKPPYKEGTSYTGASNLRHVHHQNGSDRMTMKDANSIPKGARVTHVTRFENAEAKIRVAVHYIEPAWVKPGMTDREKEAAFLGARRKGPASARSAARGRRRPRPREIVE
jgi:hypothetical protein